MGDIRLRDGSMEHETAPGRWERVAIDACGKPLSVCLHGEKPAAVVDPLGMITMELGGVAVSMPPDVAAAWGDALATLAGKAADVRLAQQFETKRQGYEDRLAEERQALDADIALRRDTLTQLAQQVVEQETVLEETRAAVAAAPDAGTEATRGDQPAGLSG